MTFWEAMVSPGYGNGQWGGGLHRATQIRQSILPRMIWRLQTKAMGRVLLKEPILIVIIRIHFLQ